MDSGSSKHQKIALISSICYHNIVLEEAKSRARQIISILKDEYPQAKYYLNFSNPLELLVAAILSAQVKDEVVNSITAKLFKKYKTAADYANASLAELQNEISKITFFKNKAKHIQEACQILLEKHNGQVPDKLEDLLQLPGIGRKTANAILINAFDKVVGIVVDTHVIRVSQRLGLTANKKPEKIEQDLMQIIPKEDWKIITWLLKYHGKAICKAPKPLCQKCVLDELCPKI